MNTTGHGSSYSHLFFCAFLSSFMRTLTRGKINYPSPLTDNYPSLTLIAGIASCRMGFRFEVEMLYVHVECLLVYLLIVV